MTCRQLFERHKLSRKNARRKTNPTRFRHRDQGEKHSGGIHKTFVEIGNCIAGRETAIDLETTGLRPWEDTICVLSVACGDDYWIVQFPSEDLLKTVVDKAGLLIGHNLKFDLAFIRYVLQERFAPKVFDTMLAAQLIEGNRGRKGRRRKEKGVKEKEKENCDT